MQKEVKVLTLNGYSRTGKSTVTKELVNLGWVKASTSDYLTKAAIVYYGLELNEATIKDFTDKQNDGYYLSRFGMNTRDMKIHVAEDILVPKYGRLAGLVQPTVDAVLTELLSNNQQKLIIETINLGEYNMFLEYLVSKQTQYFRFDFLTPIYLKRDGELKGVDSRVPFGKPIDNNGSIEQTMAEILGYLRLYCIN